MTAGVYQRCVAVDAGADATDGADAVAEVSLPECTDDRQCLAERPVCGAGGTCGACSAGIGQACATNHASTPVCGPSGACVECAVSSDCHGNAKPVCNPQSFRCVPCQGDADCAGRAGPGVCMAHQDGRCASEAETIYVQQVATCASVADPASGGATTPFCGLDKGASALSPTRRLFVIRGTVQGTAWTLQGAPGDAPVSIVGQQSATIAGGASPGLNVVSADLYVRQVLVTLSAQIGISASNGATLRLDAVKVDTNRGGGILIDASRFDIRNTVVTGNGPGLLPGDVSWGGMRVQNPPATAPLDLNLVTITNNAGPGLLCTSAIQGAGVRASANSTIDVGTACGITPCGAPSATCGAM
jgi:hypothetical protein